jgi:hypothetical protein
MHNVYQKNGEFWQELNRIIQDQGFTINDKKTRLQKLGARQEVTGIIVSEKLNVTQKYVRDIRNILYIWNRYGYGVAYGKFYPKYKDEKGHVKKGEPDLMNVIDGKLMYLKMVKGEEDSVYKSLYDKFAVLVEREKGINITTAQNITYVETTSVLDFEKKHSTVISITMSAPKIISEEEVEPGHRYAYFMLEENKIFASVHKDVELENEVNKLELAISLCRDVKGKLFWLIHRIDKVIFSPSIDIDELNNDLDSFLNI